MNPAPGVSRQDEMAEKLTGNRRGVKRFGGQL
jgi:hypothetical protein